jgi:hypothetical protein
LSLHDERYTGALVVVCREEERTLLCSVSALSFADLSYTSGHHPVDDLD